MRRLLFCVSALGLLFLLAAPVSALAYTVSVHTDSSSYAGTSTVLISGQVSPAPGPGTGVLIRIFNPNGVLVTADPTTVNGTTGLFSDSVVIGGSSAWVNGNYVVNATWGAYGPAVSGAAGFSWSKSTTTTTTSTSVTQTSSSASSTSTSTISTSTSASTSSLSSSATTSSSTTSMALSTSTTSSSTSASTTNGGGGGIPEFPFQWVAVGLFSALIVASYLVITRGRGRTFGPR